MTSRSKFTVQSVTKTGEKHGSVILAPQYDSALHTEDHAFQTATPWGEIKLGLSGSGTQVDFFKPGAVFYVDFTPVESA